MPCAPRRPARAHRRARARRHRRPGARVAALATLVLAPLAVLTTTPSAQAAEVVTPGSFTGFGFDTCNAPSQSDMDAWWRSSPYQVVGVYTSGSNRYCDSQPNLTPTWVSTQTARGWRLLPITVGAQSRCFSSGRNLSRISNDSTDGYATARRQGRGEARGAMRAAGNLGIGAGSTLWYDIEGFDVRNTTCARAALAFLAGWTQRIHADGYVSGVYSSASSMIAKLDAVRQSDPDYPLPDQLWFAHWNGVADATTPYLDSDGWMPHARVHQYRGDFVATYGGVRHAIDANWVDVGEGTVVPPPEVHCGGIRLFYRSYQRLVRRDVGAQVATAGCLLQEKGYLPEGTVSDVFDAVLAEAVKAFRTDHGLPARAIIGRRTWTALLADGGQPLLKFGSGGENVRRVQRAMNAAVSAGIKADGYYGSATTSAVMAWQKKCDLAVTGVMNRATWTRLKAGR